MNKIRLVFVASAMTLLPIAAFAQSVSEISELGPDERRAYMHSMSKEERQAMREKWREEMDAMPQEEREAMRERMRAQRPGGGDRAAMRQRWDSMSDEERAAFREQRKAQKAERRQKWQSMSDEERAAAREKMGTKKGMGKRQHRGEPKGGSGNTDSE